MSKQIIDLDALRRLRDVIGGDPDDLAELIADFISDTPPLLLKMRTAQADQDWHAMRLSAHSLKSNARDLGAIELSSLCAALEHECKVGVPQELEGQLTAIETALNAAHDSLKQIKLADV